MTSDVTMERVARPPALPPRAASSHKGTFGRVLIVAGSREMSGAAVLCGSAALRGGAGLVQVACPADAHPLVAVGNPCYTTVVIGHRADGTYSDACLLELVRRAEQADVVAIGPGLGQRDDVRMLVRGLVADLPQKPIILDADALNALAPWDASPTEERPAAMILTPHPGEFARLVGMSTAAVQADREAQAFRFARQHRVILLLKGHGTIVTDGRRVYCNDTGNPGMATGGTGDVLTGLIAALHGQGMPAFDAAVLGAWVHGRAGDLAAAHLGQVALTARDLLDYLPPALREVTPG